MLLFGHAGITLGAATLIAGVTAKKRNSGKENPSWFTSLSRFVDIRFLLIGSLLPDIIDKPVAIVVNTIDCFFNHLVWIVDNFFQCPFLLIPKLFCSLFAIRITY